MEPFFSLSPAPRGQTMLKVVGIILIVFCGLAIISQLLNLFTLPFIISEGDWQDASSIVAIATAFLFYLPADLGLVAGILGISAAGKPKKAAVCFRFGVALMALPFLPFIVSLYVWKLSESLMLILLFVPVFILGLLYTIGAYQYKKCWREYLQARQKEVAQNER